MRKKYRSIIELQAETSQFQSGLKGIQNALTNTSKCTSTLDKLLHKAGKNEALTSRFQQSIVKSRQLNKELNDTRSRLEELTRTGNTQGEAFKYLTQKHSLYEKQLKREALLLGRTKAQLGNKSVALAKLGQDEERYAKAMERRGRRIERIYNRTKLARAGGALVENLPMMQLMGGNPTALLGQQVGGILGGARGARLGMGLGLAGAVAGAGIGMAAGAYQSQLPGIYDRDTAYRLMQNTGGYNRLTDRSVRGQMKRISRTTLVEEDGLIEGMQMLLAEGLDRKDALPMMETLAKAKVGSGAEMQDLAALAASLKMHFGVKPGQQFSQALDVLAKSGKLGSFELKDMAAYLPQLGPQLNMLKMGSGDQLASIGAFLQTAKKGAKDPAIAANNFFNLLNKMQSNDVVNNFKGRGVNILDLVQNPQKYFPTAQNSLEAFVMKTMELTKNGTDAAALNNLFGDQQVKAAILPLMQNWQNYLNTRNASAKQANGTLEADFKNSVDGMGSSSKRLSIAWQQSTSTMADAFSPLTNRWNTVLAGMLESATRHAPLIKRAMEVVASARLPSYSAGGAITPTMEINKPMHYNGRVDTKSSIHRILHPLGRATGGSVSPGVPTRVGEGGPELIVAQQAGHVYPNYAPVNPRGTGHATVQVFVNTLPSQQQLQAFLAMLNRREQIAQYDGGAY